MKERIEAIIQHEHITPSQFADAIGVQRSGISHILSGRNKPSLDFLNKLLQRYPHISGDWLITGKGNMLNGQIEALKPTEQLSFPMADKKPRTSFKVPKKELKEEEVAEYVAPKPTPVTKVPILPAPEGKTIERIVVFYNDKSFSEYKPE
ncbi:helix-turn-helix transcriptional regulator [Carboxylicivirga sp. M1479]|uniref:helix-turn-helix domain-containing protein n=1 Tax=Carboxylicivirga sp. M1479 TaxID=2594476 RepID=UPI001177488C|nr:helix-turn-helix transcriptional regulator [Carboxylicivirga sp. M1479]TRX70585.1 helix-turn-helix transcriptional regulator [Carboxylicivirga sp. M1479]